MKIHMLKTLRSPELALDAGKNYDLPKETAESLIASQAATRLEAKPAVETAAAPAVETRRKRKL